MSAGSRPRSLTFMFRLFAQSHRNYYLDGWVEDGFCVPNPSDCPHSTQAGLAVDFSVQAIGHEALLEALTAQSKFPVAAVDTTAWFYTDVILGESAWPITSQSDRDKPAEVIDYLWFKKK